MKNLKNLTLAVVAALAVVASANAVQNRKVPNDQKGMPIAHPLYGGYSVKYISNTTETMVCSGKCLLAGMIRSTGSVNTVVTIRATGTADGGGEVWIPKVHYQPDTGAHDNPVPLPVIVSSISTGGMSAALSSTSQGETLGVLYLDLDD